MNLEEWSREAKTGTRLLSVSAMSVAALFFLGFGGWASTAPLSGAVVVPGTVVANGHNQSIQHLEGGIVRTILVKEGERVIKDEPLVVFDSTAAKAQRDSLQKKLISLRARAARLSAERDGLDALHFLAALKRMSADHESQETLGQQRREFDARLQRHHQEQAIMRQRISALHQQIDGLKVQRQALASELTVVREETTRKKKLLDKGLTQRSEYTRLLRSEAELVGQSGQAVSNLLAAKTQVSEAREQLERLTSQRVETAVSELNDVRAKISDTVEQLRSAQDVVSRLVVRSPSNGIVVKMNVNVEGSVLNPGDPILELLPTGQHLLVEARVAPRDIDTVSVGQTARLRFSALNVRRTPKVDATVTYVSADRLLDQARHQPYYTARLRIADPLPAGIRKNQLYPGMPVEAYITTKGRTFAEYLVKPITDSFSKAFKQD